MSEQISSWNETGNIDPGPRRDVWLTAELGVEIENLAPIRWFAVWTPDVGDALRFPDINVGATFYSMLVKRESKSWRLSLGTARAIPDCLLRIEPGDLIEIPANERICQFCKHCDLTMGDPGYSEETPGSNFSMSCMKKHWEHFDGVLCSEAEFVESITSARVCPDFEVNPRLYRAVPKRI